MIQDPFDPFDPWRAVAERDDLIMSIHPVAQLMGGGFYARVGDFGVIVIDPALEGDMRRAVLTHELVHHERGGGVARAGSDTTPTSLVSAEERCVEREVAARLVPPVGLGEFIRSSTRAGDAVGAVEVADHFEVPVAVATLALEELRRRPTRCRPARRRPKNGEAGRET